MIPARGLLRGKKRFAAGLIDLVGGIAARLRNRLLSSVTFNRADVKRILLMRLDHIGDVLMSTAFIESLAGVFPEAGIDVMVKPSCAPLLINNPNVVNILPYAAPWTMRHMDDGGVESSSLPDLHGKYDLVFSARGDMRENRLVAATGAKWRVGFDVRGGGFFLTHIAEFDEAIHQTARDRALIYSLGINNVSVGRQRLFLSDDERHQAENFLQKAVGIDPKKSFVVINSGAASPLKNWGLENFIETAVVFAANNIEVVILSPPGEEEACREIAVAASSVKVIPFLPLREVAAIMQLADVVICNDSGPMHLAIAAGTSVVAVFGPTIKDVTGPLPGQGVALSTPEQDRVRWFPGTPAPSAEECRRSYDGITPHRVFESVIEFIDKKQ